MLRVYSKGAKEKRRETAKKRKDKPIMGSSYICGWVSKAPDYWNIIIKYRKSRYINHSPSACLRRSGWEGREQHEQGKETAFSFSSSLLPLTAACYQRTQFCTASQQVRLGEERSGSLYSLCSLWWQQKQSRKASKKEIKRRKDADQRGSRKRGIEKREKKVKVRKENRIKTTVKHLGPASVPWCSPPNNHESKQILASVHFNDH